MLFLYIIKMVIITAEAYENAKVHDKENVK